MLLLVAALDPSVTIAVFAAAIGPIGAYLVAARRLSGKIANSDAEQLWAESKSIRDWSKDRLESCEDEIRELREALGKISSRLAVVEAENENLRSINAVYRRRLHTYQTDEPELERGTE